LAAIANRTRKGRLGKFGAASEVVHIDPKSLDVSDES
jgi:hypothetical protein